MNSIKGISNSLLDLITISQVDDNMGILDVIRYDEKLGIILEFVISNDPYNTDQVYHMSPLRYNEDDNFVVNDNVLHELKVFTRKYNRSGTSDMFMMNSAFNDILDDYEIINKFKQPVISLYPNTDEMINRWRRIFKPHESANYIFEDKEFNILVFELDNLPRFQLMTSFTDTKSIFPGNVDVYHKLLSI